MEEASIYDNIVEELKSRNRLVKEELRRRFKGVKPFRMEKISRKERLMQYDEMIAREDWLRQNYGDEVVDAYKSKFQEELGGE